MACNRFRQLQRPSQHENLTKPVRKAWKLHQYTLKQSSNGAGSEILVEKVVSSSLKLSEVANIKKYASSSTLRAFSLTFCSPRETAQRGQVTKKRTRVCKVAATSFPSATTSETQFAAFCALKCSLGVFFVALDSLHSDPAICIYFGI